jgi:hypothetical protein
MSRVLRTRADFPALAHPVDGVLDTIAPTHSLTTGRAPPTCENGYLMGGPMCGVDFSFSLQMNSKSSVPSVRRALVVTVHGFV